jgi:hypothetical protein
VCEATESNPAILRFDGNQILSLTKFYF